MQALKHLTIGQEIVDFDVMNHLSYTDLMGKSQFEPFVMLPKDIAVEPLSA
jgi:hypothetical protein